MYSTALVYTELEAHTLFTSGVEFSSAIALTPQARAALLASGFRGEITQPLDYFSDAAFAQAMRDYRAYYLEIDQRIAEDDLLSDAARMLIHYGMRSVWISAHRLASFVSGERQWLIPTRDGFVHQTTDDLDAQRLVFNVFFGYLKINWIGYHRYHPPPCSWLFRFIRNLLCRLSPRLDNPVHTTRSEHPYGMEEDLLSAGATFVHTVPVHRGWREYLVLLRETVRRFRGAPLIQVRTLSEPDDRVRARVLEILEASERKILGPALSTVANDLSEQIMLVEGLKVDTDLALKIDGASRYFGYEVADGYTAHLADRVKARGGIVVIMNHNTHSNSPGEIGQLAVDEMARTMHPPYLVDFAFVWTPEALTTVQRACRDSADGCTVGPVYRTPTLLNKERVAKRTENRAKFVILYASNGHRWMRGFSWIFEFTDEFFRTSEIVLQECAKLPDTEIIARMKFRAEVNRSLFEGIIAEAGNVKLSARSELPFREDLIHADLLISFSSTTIYEALASRIPVLLWSSTDRYLRLPCLRQIPTRTNRAAVYTVDKPEEIAPMIEAIRMAHSDQPLTDEEVAPFLFAEELADRRADLAASILSGRFEMESYCAETNHCLPLSNSEVVTRQTHSVRLSEDAS